MQIERLFAWKVTSQEVLVMQNFTSPLLFYNFNYKRYLIWELIPLQEFYYVVPDIDNN